jgi:AraC-like DNA-binding protein
MNRQGFEARFPPAHSGTQRALQASPQLDAGSEFQALGPLLRLPRHRHAEPYAALVLSGGYVEAGDAGRRRMTAGDVAFHRAFEAHANVVAKGGARVLNLPLRSASVDPTFGRVSDADAIARAAEHDAARAGDMLLHMSFPSTCDMADWPDLLAHELRSASPVRLAEWALRHDLAPATVSRSFRSAFGVSPKRYRLEQHALAALRLLELGSASIADTAAATGFADQAHLTRTVRALTGRTPRSWRR